MKLHRMFYGATYKTIDEMIYGEDAARHNQSASAMAQEDDYRADADDAKHAELQGMSGPPASVHL